MNTFIRSSIVTATIACGFISASAYADIFHTRDNNGYNLCINKIERENRDARFIHSPDYYVEQSDDSRHYYINSKIIKKGVASPLRSSCTTTKLASKVLEMSSSNGRYVNASDPAENAVAQNLN